MGQPCRTSCGLPLLVEIKRHVLVRDRNLEIISILLVTKARSVDEIKMERPIGGKKAKRIWYLHAK